MKKIINGKLYNTDTAQAIHTIFGAESQSDLCYYEETLYKKRTGEYFLYGEGGPNSKYGRRIDSNSWGYGYGFSPISYGRAKQWAEDHMDADAFMKEFGPVSEDDGRVSINLSLSASVAETIRREAAQNGISVSECISKKFSHSV